MASSKHARNTVISVSVAAPTLTTAAPPASFARRSCMDFLGLRKTQFFHLATNLLTANFDRSLDTFSNNCCCVFW